MYCTEINTVPPPHSSKTGARYKKHMENFDVTNYRMLKLHTFLTPPSQCSSSC
jgi:hypothetical protein